jgi:putative heme-binding domain-containing protein
MSLRYSKSRTSLLLFVCASIALQAQHSYTAADIAEGGRLFRANCVLCHGPEGDQVPGIDLGHGKFRQTYSEDALIKIIQNGIPGTAMPPHNLQDFQAGTIVGYLRTVATSGRTVSGNGNAARGKAVFEGKGGCMGCHRVGAAGSRTGPDLSDVGSQRRAVEIEQSVLDPDAEILPQNRYYRVTTKSGETITGRLLNIDSFTVQLLDSKERLMSFPKSSLSESAFIDKSPMPSYRDKLSSQELADLVAYLVSLKGV